MLPKSDSVTVKKLSHWIKVTLLILKKSRCKKSFIKGNRPKQNNNLVTAVEGSLTAQIGAGMISWLSLGKFLF